MATQRKWLTMTSLQKTGLCLDLGFAGVFTVLQGFKGFARFLDQLVTQRKWLTSLQKTSLCLDLGFARFSARLASQEI